MPKCSNCSKKKRKSEFSKAKSRKLTRKKKIKCQNCTELARQDDTAPKKKETLNPSGTEQTPLKSKATQGRTDENTTQESIKKLCKKYTIHEDDMSNHHFVMFERKIYVLPIEVRELISAYLASGTKNYYRLALLHLKRAIDDKGCNLDKDWEEFRMKVLREIIQKLNLSIDIFDMGQDYVSFETQYQVNLACAERYMIGQVVPRWREFEHAEYDMFPYLFRNKTGMWDVDRQPYRLHTYLQCVNNQPIRGAPQWYKLEKEKYIKYMTEIEKNISILLRANLEQSRTLHMV